MLGAISRRGLRRRGPGDRVRTEGHDIMNVIAPATQNPTSQEVIERAALLQPLLRATQDATEASRGPTRDVYDAIAHAGLFGIVKPKRYGGYELPLETFHRTIIELSRGDPNVGWWFALGAGHAVQVATYFTEAAQEAIFGARADFHAPWAFTGQGRGAVRKQGGWEISGTWNYCSGLPWASHFMGALEVKDEAGERLMAFIVPQGGFVALDNWGDLIGMKGSGSQSARLDKVFVPDLMTFVVARAKSSSLGRTPGGALHGNPLYNGNFFGLGEGGLAAVAVGTGLAMYDEVAELTATKQYPGRGHLRAHDDDILRKLGMVIARLDAAECTLIEAGRRFVRCSAEAMEGIAPFDDERALRLDGVYHQVEATVYEAMQMMARIASSGALKDGSRIARYLNGMLMLVTRVQDEFEFRAADVARSALARSHGIAYPD
jgi:3-hydroxy-9,10-secoandrosta-1,3,5(10)-triene-9,17-dione monooxygenase